MGDVYVNVCRQAGPWCDGPPCCCRRLWEDAIAAASCWGLTWENNSYREASVASRSRSPTYRDEFWGGVAAGVAAGSVAAILSSSSCKRAICNRLDSCKHDSSLDLFFWWLPDQSQRRASARVGLFCLVFLEERDASS